MELLKVEDVHLTYPPRFRREEGGGPDAGDLDDGYQLGVSEDQGGTEPRATGNEPVIALRGVSLSVSAGEGVGLLGHVGSGRSTLLAVIRGVLRPDAGRVLIRGYATGIMAAGAGFFGDLTVRDNIIRNAVLMGMPWKRAEELAPGIAEFAGVPETLNEVLRDVSRANTRRIGYATALHAEPSLFLADEELVVGPADLREAGLERMASFPDDAHALLVATNRSTLLRRLCTRAIVLENGRVAFDGDLEEGLVFFRKPQRRADPDDAEDSGDAEGEG